MVRKKRRNAPENQTTVHLTSTITLITITFTTTCTIARSSTRVPHQLNPDHSNNSGVSPTSSRLLSWARSTSVPTLPKGYILLEEQNLTDATGPHRVLPCHQNNHTRKKSLSTNKKTVPMMFPLKANNYKYKSIRLNLSNLQWFTCNKYLTTWFQCLRKCSASQCLVFHSPQLQEFSRMMSIPVLKKLHQAAVNPTLRVVHPMNLL